MVRIRLRQVGGRNQASFRIVAADRESPRNGRFIEILGYYNPRTQPATIQLKEDRIYQWMSKGAQPSDSASALFKTTGLDARYERFKTGDKIETLLAEAQESAAARNSNPKTRFSAPSQSKKPRRKEGESAPTAPATEPVAEANTADEAPAEATAE
jgi:small subunit ribosomal protein S16